MCGLALWVGRGNAEAGDLDRRCLAAKEVLARRGPDAQHARVVQMGGVQIAMVATRLAIIAPTPDNDQPIRTDDGCWALLNGTIFNHALLRKALPDGLETDPDGGDTRVLLNAYRAWGPQAWEQLRGMFACVVIDPRQDAIIAARDSFGEKPLVWCLQDGGLWIGSNAAALSALGASFHADREALMRNLALGYRSAMTRSNGGTGAFLGGLNSVPPGHVLRFRLSDPHSPPAVSTFFSLRYRLDRRESLTDPAQGAPIETVECLRTAMRQAVSACCVADVPMALRLSGGIDSGLISGVMHELGWDPVAYVMTPPGPDNETTLIKAQAAHSGACLRWIEAPDGPQTLAWMEFLAHHSDAPLLTMTTVLNAHLHAAIHQDGVKVTLSGTGADELFTGYYEHAVRHLADVQESAPWFLPQCVEQWRMGIGRFARDPRWRWDEHWPLRNALDRIPVSDPHAMQPLWNKELRWRHDHARVHNDCLIDGGPMGLATRRLSQIRDETLPVLLHQDDLAAMTNGVENRTPFLSPDLAQFAFSVPSGQLIGRGFAKDLLRRAGQGWLIDAVRLNPAKTGFASDFCQIIPQNCQTARRLLDTTPLSGLIDPDALIRHAGSGLIDSARWFSVHATGAFLCRWSLSGS